MTCSGCSRRKGENSGPSICASPTTFGRVAVAAVAFPTVASASALDEVSPLVARADLAGIDENGVRVGIGRSELFFRRGDDDREVSADELAPLVVGHLRGSVSR